METWKASLFDNKPLTDRRPDQSSGALKGKRLSVLGHWLYFFCEQKKNILLFTKRPRLNRTSEHTVAKYWTHWLGIQLLALWGISEAKVAKKLHDTSLAAKYFWCFGVIKMWQQSMRQWHCWRLQWRSLYLSLWVTGHLHKDSHDMMLAWYKISPSAVKMINGQLLHTMVIHTVM